MLPVVYNRALSWALAGILELENVFNINDNNGLVLLIGETGLTTSNLSNSMSLEYSSKSYNKKKQTLIRANSPYIEMKIF